MVTCALCHGNFRKRLDKGSGIAYYFLIVNPLGYCPKQNQSLTEWSVIECTTHTALPALVTVSRMYPNLANVFIVNRKMQVQHMCLGHCALICGWFVSRIHSALTPNACSTKFFCSYYIISLKLFLKLFFMKYFSEILISNLNLEG